MGSGELHLAKGGAPGGVWKWGQVWWYYGIVGLTNGKHAEGPNPCRDADVDVDVVPLVLGIIKFRF